MVRLENTDGVAQESEHIVGAMEIFSLFLYKLPENQGAKVPLVGSLLFSAAVFLSPSPVAEQGAAQPCMATQQFFPECLAW